MWHEQQRYGLHLLVTLAVLACVLCWGATAAIIYLCVEALLTFIVWVNE